MRDQDPRSGILVCAIGAGPGQADGPLAELIRPRCYRGLIAASPGGMRAAVRA